MIRFLKLQVAIINKSEALLPISFEPSRQILNAIDIELLPYDGLRLKPHHVRSMPFFIIYSIMISFHYMLL